MEKEKITTQDKVTITLNGEDTVFTEGVVVLSTPSANSAYAGMIGSDSKSLAYGLITMISLCEDNLDKGLLSSILATASADLDRVISKCNK